MVNVQQIYASLLNGEAMRTLLIKLESNACEELPRNTSANCSRDGHRINENMQKWLLRAVQCIPNVCQCKSGYVRHLGNCIARSSCPVYVIHNQLRGQ
ncbi:hypothetical protein Q1695_007349 [Nippostrongylus brasiliensis]|nr:hypothetical protein Q1695_007349 [Nippostrongylus brasiliensis]